MSKRIFLILQIVALLAAVLFLGSYIDAQGMPKEHPVVAEYRAILLKFEKMDQDKKFADEIRQVRSLLAEFPGRLREITILDRLKTVSPPENFEELPCQQRVAWYVAETRKSQDKEVKVIQLTDQIIRRASELQNLVNKIERGFGMGPNEQEYRFGSDEQFRRRRSGAVNRAAWIRKTEEKIAWNYLHFTLSTEEFGEIATLIKAAQK